MTQKAEEIETVVHNSDEQRTGVIPTRANRMMPVSCNLAYSCIFERFVRQMTPDCGDCGDCGAITVRREMRNGFSGLCIGQAADSAIALIALLAMMVDHTHPRRCTDVELKLN